MTIEQFVLEHFSAEQRAEVRPLIDRFIAVFNALRVAVFQRGRGGAAAQRSLAAEAAAAGAQMDYSTSAAAALFPSGRDAGQCAVQLVAVLIEAHNRLMRSVCTDRWTAFHNPLKFDFWHLAVIAQLGER